jgi:hypothetical protein
MTMSWRYVGIGFVCFTFIALVFATQERVFFASYDESVTWRHCLTWKLGAWYIWGLLCPLIFWLCRRIPLTRGSWPRAVAAHVVCALLVTSLHVAIYATWTSLTVPLHFAGPGWQGAVMNVFHTTFSWELLGYAGIVIAFYALHYARRHRDGQMHAARLEAQLARAQLDALRMQLHPHFLFNTLNAITALVRDDPSGAEDMVTRLSDLLRLALDKSDAADVPLREELEFVRKYLDIQCVRFGDRLEVNMDIDPETLDVPVPTFILQPIVENAVRHGLQAEQRQCRVRVVSKREGDMLVLEVHDTGPGLDRAASGPARRGIGIANTRARLEQVYGPRAQFDLRAGVPRGCVATVRVPMTTPPAIQSHTGPL